MFFMLARPEARPVWEGTNSRNFIAVLEGANSVNRPVIIASYTSIYICVPMPQHWAYVQGWSKAMYETDARAIPHAHTVNTIDDPPCVTLYVETALVQNPSTPGFKADAKQEMLMAIAEMVEREGLDGYRIIWSVPSPALAPTPIRRGTASAA